MTETPDGPHTPQDPQTPHIPSQAGRHPYAGPERRRPEAAGAPGTYGPPVDHDTGRPTGPQTGPLRPDLTRPDGTVPAGGPRSPEVGPPGAVPPEVGPPGAVPPTGASPAAPAGQPAVGQLGVGQLGVGQLGVGQLGVGQLGAGSPAVGEPGTVPAAGPDLTAPTGPWTAGRSGAPDFTVPYAGDRVAVQERPARARGTRRLVAVAALTAVLGGVAGGGAVVLLDRNDAAPVASAGLSRESGSAPAAATTAGTTEAAAAAALKSVVTLNVTGAQESGTGSGVVIRADGYILTNQHVVAVAQNGGSVTATLPDGRTVPATIVGTDTVTDLAVVKVAVSGLTAVTFADSDAVKIGQTVVAVGSPLGLDGTVTEGIVSALHRPTTGGSDNSAVIDALQTDAAINVGNSGGPLVDLAGRLVGINQSIATASSGGGFPGQTGSSGNIGIGFAIPSNTAARVAEQLISSGKATHAYLGVQAGRSGPTAAPGTGATLASVESGGPAAAAGLKAGDVVTKIDDRVVDSSDELVAAVRSYAPGDEVTLTVRRGGQEQTVTVTLGSDDRQ